ncbi:MAG TPA: site-2 protease family protein [Actinomycetota bacterium]|nr:site-2 protease family protein [Actinomycetota bacterium]
MRFALYLLVALAPSLFLHEYAHALTADRLGDPTPRRWGRLSFNPRPLIDPFGTVILPGLLLVLIASGLFVPLFAYTKPFPHDPTYLRNRERDELLVQLSGPLLSLALAVIAGIVLRTTVAGEAGLFIFAVVYVNLLLFVFNLMPIPGLDGARILARFLPPRAREVYRNLDQYLALFMLLVFFLLGGLFLGIVNALSGGLCRAVTGGAGLCGIF